jgi:choline dehydrogenase-like flavoprotein
VVLAAGALENPRLLLQSDARRPGGLGNAHGQVGRGLRDQMVLRAGHLALPGDGPLAPAFRAAAPHAGAATPIRAVLRPTASLQRRHELLNSLISFEAVRSDRGDDLAPAVAGMARNVAALDGGPPLPPGHHLALVLVRGEQTANADSRVRLGRGRDGFGRRRIEVSWEVTEHDVWSLRTTARLLGEALGRRHAGRLQYRGGYRSSRRRLQWSGHASGTTRMSPDPEVGVVDLDCRLHDVENVYVAGASVFPTGGCSGPLLTEVALALRLGGHLTARLAGR